MVRGDVDVVRAFIVTGAVGLLFGCPGFRIVHVVPECPEPGVNTCLDCPDAPACGDGGQGGAGGGVLGDGGGNGAQGGADGGVMGGDGGSGSTVEFHNYMFVTRGSYLPRTFGDGDGGVPIADAICKADATQRGIPGHFIALLSTSKRDVRDRIPPGVRGWFLETIYSVDRRVLDQLGDPWFYERIEDDPSPYSTTTTKVATGSTPWGTFKGPACDDWTSNSPAQSFRVGDSTRWFPDWADDSTLACDTPARLYCLQIDYQSPLPQGVPPGVPRAFVTRWLHSSGRGLAGFDADCAAEAAAAGLVGHFQAYLATESQGANQRLWKASGIPRGDYHRIDGVPLLITRFPLGRAPMNVTADVRFLVPDGGVWPSSPRLVDSDPAIWSGAYNDFSLGENSTCTDWFSQMGTGYVRNAMGVDWGRIGRSCSESAHLACVEVP